jgi:hypothetical protein
MLTPSFSADRVGDRTERSQGGVVRRSVLAMVLQKVDALLRTARHLLVAASDPEMAAEASGMPGEHGASVIVVGHDGSFPPRYGMGV